MAVSSLARWLRDALDFYRARDFFAASQESNEQMANKLAEALAESMGEGGAPRPEDDVILLAMDPSRALYDQLSFGDALAPGRNVYVNVLDYLGRISRGAFLPGNLKEHWETRHGPIKVTFTLNEKERSVTAGHWEGFFDFRILLQLNALMWDTPFRFEMVPLDDMLFVTVLKAEEKCDIERLRGLCFMVLDLPRLFYPLYRLVPERTLPAPGEIATYAGTLNEILDRCVGRFVLELSGEEAEGELVYRGEDHQEELLFSGRLNAETGRLEGKIEGRIIAGGEARPYLGRWEGLMAPGNRVVTGTWRGWFKDESLEEPPRGKGLYRGQWAALESGVFESRDPYIQKVCGWLERVWQADSAAAYPWLLEGDS